MSYYVWYLWYYRLEAEVDEVVGKKSFISYDDITKFTYMTTLIKETLRVHPPITIIMRNTAADSEVDGLHIPAKTNIMVLFINTFTCMLQTMRFNAHWTTMQFNDKTWLLWFSLKLKYNSCDNITDVTAITHKKNKYGNKQKQSRPCAQYWTMVIFYNCRWTFMEQTDILNMYKNLRSLIRTDLMPNRRIGKFNN